MTKNKFDIQNYFIEVEKEVTDIISKTSTDTVTQDLLLNSDNVDHLNILKSSLKLKQLQMKIGEIWQVVIGEYDGFENLRVGHETKLDVRSVSRKLIFEIKNRYNTDNSSARTANLNKLSTFKSDNPKYTTIYGVINDTRPEGRVKIIEHDGEDIYYYSGDELFKFIFGEDKDRILSFIKNLIQKLVFDKI